MSASRIDDNRRSHRLLAKVALSPHEDAIAAWRQWTTEFSLDELDGEGYWILPLLFSKLSGAGLGELPGDFPERQRLAGVYKQMRMRNAIAEPRLWQALDSLAQAGCDVLPGAISALPLAGGEAAIALDPCELLVPAQSLVVAHSIFQSLGWQTLMPLPPNELQPFVASVRMRHDKAGDAILCWRPFGLDSPVAQDAGLWQRAAAVPAGERAIRLPQPADQLRMIRERGTYLQQCVLMNRLGNPIDLIGPSTRTLQDAVVSLPRLAARHWRRFKSCSAALRPPGFLTYLLAYYRHAWQVEGFFEACVTASKRMAARFTARFKRLVI